MAHFTKENAKEYAAKGLAARLRTLHARKTEPLKILESNEGPVHDRLLRLWDCLESIDERIRRELRKEVPSLKVARDLAALAKDLQAQARDIGAPATNGRPKASAPAAPDLPDPTPDP